MKYIIPIIFCSIASIVKAQSIDKLIAQTEEYLSVYYDTLCIRSMWSGCPKYYSLKGFNFSKEELKDINVENDSIDADYIIGIFHEKILTNIDKIAHHKDFPQKGSKLFLASPDEKLFNFKLFENTGGSHKSYISVIYYKENGNIMYEEYSSEESSGNGVFEIDGYNKIDTIQTATGVKYFLQGSSVTCMTCHWQYIRLVKFETGKPISEFSYELDTCDYGFSENIDYNPETKTITIEYETNDLTADCYCIEGIDGHAYSRFSRDEDEDVQKNCRCVFVFNGETFELDEYCWSRIRDDNNQEK